MNFEQAEFALNDLQRGPHICSLQRHVGTAENLVARSHLDVQLGHAGDGHVALAGGRHVRRRLRLHAVDEGIGSKLEVHQGFNSQQCRMA